MTLEELRESFADENHPANRNPERLNFFRELCQDSRRIEMELNTSYHTPEEIVERMASKNIGGGIPLGRFYQNMKNCLLIAVTEMNTKEDIDNFVKELSEGAKK